jgi:hypothetical protein
MYKENSKYSELKTEIKHFAKMVAQLEVLVQQSAESPEVQWRARILSRSAQEADRDIADKLYWYEKSLVDKGKQKEARTVQAACMKLHNDFHRVHATLGEALCEYECRQRSDASLLGGAISYPESNSMLLKQEQVSVLQRGNLLSEEAVIVSHSA